MTFRKVPDKKKIREDLLLYCKRDTEAMVWIVREMGKVIK